MSKFSNLLKEVINQSNNTIYSIAKEINYDRATLTNQINGKRKMSKDVFLKVINNINITENTKQKLILAYHREYLGEYNNTFEIIKDSFTSYFEISLLRNIDNQFISNYSSISIPTGKIEGKLYIINSIQNIISRELQEDSPNLCINLDPSNQELLSFITKAYSRLSKTKEIKMNSIINFFTNTSSAIDNFKIFINMLPLLLSGHCPYYCFIENSIKSNMAVLFPYYVITSNHLIVISQWYESAYIIDNKEIIDFYKSEFFNRIKRCKKFTLESINLFDMPELFNSCLDDTDENILYGFSEQFCALPFLTANDFTHMFANSIDDIDNVSSTLLSCYGKVSSLISYCPVESIMQFAKTGKDSHTDIEIATPLSKEMRIDVLRKIQFAIKNGQGYHFIAKNNFFNTNLTFNIISDSKIVFFSQNDKDSTKENISVITTPSGLLNELKEFFFALSKSCYVLSEQDAIDALEQGIQYINDNI